ncbi:MAG: isoprenyl transferase [Jiangellales bacterium]
MALTDLAYGVYERRLARSLDPAKLPHHVGVILDGNRRWARSAGFDASTGHERGAAKIVEFLGWCDDAGVELVTLWMLSTDNLARPATELEALVSIIERAVDSIADTRRWRVHLVGSPDVLPASLHRTLKDAADRTADIDGMLVNVAVGYGGREEIADAVRSLLAEHSDAGTSLADLAEQLSVEHIAAHLYTRGQPDPDLVIRTSGEQRLSGFLMWQSAHSEFYFCEAMWPDFRRVDFLRALRAYEQRERRFGG